MEIRWLFGTSTQKHAAGDYQIRLCDEGLWEYSDSLNMLSRRLLAVNSRGGMEDAECWFAGYLDPEKTIYLVAVGGMQRTLLGPDRPLEGGYREQYCVMAYGFTEEADLEAYQEQILRKDNTMFEPLKEIMWKKPPIWRCEVKDVVQRSFSFIRPDIRQNNIFASCPERNRSLWENSRNSPVALDILSVDDARKMITLLPELKVTVKEDVAEMCYMPPRETVTKKVPSKETHYGEKTSGMAQKTEQEQRIVCQNENKTGSQQKNSSKEIEDNFLNNISPKKVISYFLPKKTGECEERSWSSRSEDIQKTVAQWCREELDDTQIRQIKSVVNEMGGKYKLRSAEVAQIEYGCLMKFYLQYKNKTISGMDDKKIVTKIVDDYIKKIKKSCKNSNKIFMEKALEYNEELMDKVKKKF